MENWAIESTYNSNAIEGSTLSLGDTALLFGGARVDAPADDISQAEGGFAALRFLRGATDDGEALTETLVKRAHELVFAEARDLATRGRYREVEVEIAGTEFQPTPAAYVAERMGQLVSSCSRSRRHPAIVAALFHLEFESIHPFVNANGRTGRLMSNYILMRAGFEPVNIQAELTTHEQRGWRRFHRALPRRGVRPGRGEPGVGGLWPRSTPGDIRFTQRYHCPMFSGWLVTMRSRSGVMEQEVATYGSIMVATLLSLNRGS